MKHIHTFELNPQKLNDQVRKGIVKVGLHSFGNGMTAEEIIDHITPTEILYIAVKKEEIIGFGTASKQGDSIYLAGAAVLPTIRGEGAYEALVLRRIEYGLRHNVTSITTRTQNPLIEKGIRSGLSHLTDLGLCGQSVVNRDIQDGAYGRLLTKEKPLSGDSFLDEIYQQLNYDRGDAFALRFSL